MPAAAHLARARRLALDLGQLALVRRWADESGIERAHEKAEAAWCFAGSTLAGRLNDALGAWRRARTRERNLARRQEAN